MSPGDIQENFLLFNFQLQSMVHLNEVFEKNGGSFVFSLFEEIASIRSGSPLFSEDRLFGETAKYAEKTGTRLHGHIPE